MPHLIDPPSRWDTTKQWQEHLARMKTLPQDDPSVRWAVKNAEQEVSRRAKAKTFRPAGWSP